MLFWYNVVRISQKIRDHRRRLEGVVNVDLRGVSFATVHWITSD